MKTFFVYTVPAILGGALTAYLLHIALPPQKGAPTLTRLGEEMERFAITRIQPVGEVIRKVADLTLPWAVERPPVPAPRYSANTTGSTVLLNQPVVIIPGKDEAMTSLPRGTQVKLVSSDGPFLRVGHDRDVVTVPKSVVVAGVSRDQ
jgi:hypothetical protein